MTRYKVYLAKRYDAEEIIDAESRDDAKAIAIDALCEEVPFDWKPTDSWVDLIEEVIDDEE